MHCALGDRVTLWQVDFSSNKDYHLPLSFLHFSAFKYLHFISVWSAFDAFHTICEFMSELKMWSKWVQDSSCRYNSRFYALLKELLLGCARPQRSSKYANLVIFVSSFRLHFIWMLLGNYFHLVLHICIGWWFHEQRQFWHFFQWFSHTFRAFLLICYSLIFTFLLSFHFLAQSLLFFSSALSIFWFSNFTMFCVLVAKGFFPTSWIWHVIWSTQAIRLSIMIDPANQTWTTTNDKQCFHEPWSSLRTCMCNRNVI